MVATQPLPQDNKPDFSDAEREAMALGKEVQAAEAARKDVQAEKTALKELPHMTRDEILEILRKPEMMISADEFKNMMKKSNEFKKLDKKGQREALTKMDPEEKRLMLKALRWHKLMLHLDEEYKLDAALLQWLESELAGEKPLSPEEFEKPRAMPEIALSEEQALLQLQKPEVRVTNEDMRRAEDLKDIPFDQWSDADKTLIPKVQEFRRLVVLLSDENRKKLAAEDAERERLLAKAEQEGWFEGLAAEKIGAEPIEMKEEKVA